MPKIGSASPVTGVTVLPPLRLQADVDRRVVEVVLDALAVGELQLAACPSRSTFRFELPVMPQPHVLPLRSNWSFGSSVVPRDLADGAADLHVAPACAPQR